MSVRKSRSLYLTDEEYQMLKDKGFGKPTTGFQLLLRENEMAKQTLEKERKLGQSMIEQLQTILGSWLVTFDPTSENIIAGLQKAVSDNPLAVKQNSRSPLFHNGPYTPDTDDDHQP